MFTVVDPFDRSYSTSLVGYRRTPIVAAAAMLRARTVVPEPLSLSFQEMPCNIVFSAVPDVIHLYIRR